MTVAEMRVSDKAMLSPKDVSEVLRCNPYSINIQAKQDISKFPFPVIMMRTRVKIPRAAFIEWCEKMHLD